MQTFFMHIEALLYHGRPRERDSDECAEIEDLENADGKCDARDTAPRLQEPDLTNHEAAEVR